METYREKLKLQNVVFAIGCVALALFSVLGFLGEAGVVKLAPSVGDGHWQSLWRGFISGASIGIGDAAVRPDPEPPRSEG